MAFKVGQRVKWVTDFNGGVRGINAPAIGSEGYIVSTAQERNPRSKWEWIVSFPGSGVTAGSELPAELFFCDSCNIAPLTPPAVDTWATEAVRKVTKPQHTEPERVIDEEEVKERLREFDRTLRGIGVSIFRNL